MSPVMTAFDDNRSPRNPRGKNPASLAAATVALVAFCSRLPALGAWWNQDDWGLLARAAGLIENPGLPIRWLSQDLYWSVLWPLAGLDPDPYTISRLLFHALIAAGVVRLAARLDLSLLQCWVAGLIMAASPLAFSALYWAAGVQDLLAVCLSVWALERWLTGGRKSVLAAAVLGLGALAAKETVVGLPILLAWLTWHRPDLRSDRRRWLLVALVGVGAVLAAVLALREFDLGPDQPYALGDPAAALANLLTYGWWLILPGPVFHAPPTVLMAVAGGLLWVAWAVWSRLQWRRGRLVPAFALLGALLMLAPILWLQRHLSPDLAFPVEPFGCLALASLLPTRWRARPYLVATLVIAAAAAGALGMLGRLHLRDADGLHADPLVRRTAVSWQVCNQLRQFPIDAGGLVILQPPLLPESAALAAKLGEQWVVGSPIFHALGGTLGPRLVLGSDRPVVWANGLRLTPADAFVVLDAGSTLKPWGPTNQALLNQVLTDVGLGHFERARRHLLRGSLLAGETLTLVYDPDILPVTLEQVLANKDAFIDHLAAGQRQGRSKLEITGLQQNFYRLLSACTGRDIESLVTPNPSGKPLPGPREDP